jgi:predicted methyltransferase
MNIRSILLYFAGIAALSACAPKGGDTVNKAPNDGAAATSETTQSAGEALDAVLAGAHRSDEEKARDQYRHPKETLLFFGAEPSMTIVEVWPGGGWYTNVLAPFVKSGGGVYYAAGLDPTSSDRARTAVEEFTAKVTGDPGLYGAVNITVLGGEGGIAPAGSADLVLTFRNVHNWMNQGKAEANFKAFYDALKPGGVLGVVEHRANEDASADFEGKSGYVKISTVKALATGAGFEFEAESEVNANPADTKDHPFGVWTLPPVRRSSAVAGQTDPDFDRSKYDAIGESDRMTLKFRKPLAADGAELN